MIDNSSHVQVMAIGDISVSYCVVDLCIVRFCVGIIAVRCQ